MTCEHRPAGVSSGCGHRREGAQSRGWEAWCVEQAEEAEEASGAVSEGRC